MINAACAHHAQDHQHGAKLTAFRGLKYQVPKP